MAERLVSATLPDRDYRALELMMHHEGRNKSDIVRVAMHEFLDKRGYWDRVPAVLRPDAGFM